jgi:hypothetical protein
VAPAAWEGKSMNYPYFNVFQRLSPAVISKAITLFADIEVSGVSDEFSVIAAAYRQTDNPYLRHELEALLHAEIQTLGSVIPL